MFDTYFMVARSGRSSWYSIVALLMVFHTRKPWHVAWSIRSTTPVCSRSYVEYITLDPRQGGLGRRPFNLEGCLVAMKKRWGFPRRPQNEAQNDFWVQLGRQGIQTTKSHRVRINSSFRHFVAWCLLCVKICFCEILQPYFFTRFQFFSPAGCQGLRGEVVL